MRLEDNEVRNHVRSVFVQATSEDPGTKPTTLFNLGEGPIAWERRRSAESTCAIGGEIRKAGITTGLRVCAPILS